MEYTFLKKLQSGEACYGMMAFEFMTPGLPAIVQQCGADFDSLDEVQRVVGTAGAGGDGESAGAGGIGVGDPRDLPGL